MTFAFTQKLCRLLIFPLLTMLSMNIYANIDSHLQNHISGEYIVKLKKSFNTFDTEFRIQSLQLLNSTNQKSFQEVLSQKLNGQVEPFNLNSPYLKVVRNPNEDVQKTVLELQQSPYIELAEPNYEIELFQEPEPQSSNILPNDEQFAKQWGLHNTSQPNEWRIPGTEGVDINIEKAWEITTGSPNIIVAIVDSGVNYNHVDLKNNLWTNTAELNGKPNIDDDANGFIDDIYGYDFFNKDSDPMDDHGHGTHIAGIIGANSNNSIGVTGINWNVKIMSIKFSNDKLKGSLEGSIKAIEYAVKMGAKIINASWGGEDSSQILADAIHEAGNKNVLFVAAAGNSARNNDAKETKPIYPASFNLTNLISVAAFNQYGELSKFSCYGPTSVHIAAPGENILSTWVDGDYKLMSGTSMAAPFVTGVAALLLAKEPNLTPAQIKERLIQSAAPLRAMKGKIFSNGRVDAALALQNKTIPYDINDPEHWPNIKDYKISSDHPYKESENKSWEIEVPGAKAISIYFSQIEMEKEYDFLDLHNRKGQLITRIVGKREPGWSRVITGDYVKITLTSDPVNENYGFDITKVSSH